MKENFSVDSSDLSVDELVAGLKTDSRRLVCIVCGEKFEHGVIYPHGEILMDSHRAADEHIRTTHGGMLAVLADLPKEKTGLSEIQQSLIVQLSAGRTDKEIARESHRAESTIRNQRFHLRRKLTEARVLSAIGRLFDDVGSPDSEFVHYHEDIPATDERIVTTRAEEKEILARYLSEENGLRMLKFPRKEKEKLVLLRRVTREFTIDRSYRESEVNDVLIGIYDDYVTLRRYLIEYRFLSREPGGKKYWVSAGV